jgi:hypothetical protein
MKHALKVIPIRVITALILISLISFIPVQVSAAAGDETSNPQLTLVPAFENISVYFSFSGDNNGNNQASLYYRQTGTGTWKPGITMTVDRRSTLDDAYQGAIQNPYRNQWRAIIFALHPSTSYDVRVDYTDADGGSGSAQSTIITRNDNPPSNGNTYYVSKSGSDTSGSGSLSNPWLTVQKAANSVSAGDTVRIMSGTYNEQVLISASGTVNNYITFESYDYNNKAIITSDADWGTFQLLGIDYNRFKQLDIRSTGTFRGSGLYIANNSEGNIIEDCLLSTAGRDWYNGGVILRSGPTNTLIQRNQITTTAMGNDGPFGVLLDETEGGNVIRYNNIIGDFYDGIGGGPNFGVNGGPYKDGYIYGNVIDGANDDGIESEGGGMNVAIWDNTITNCWNFSIAVCPVIIGPTYIFRNVCIDTGTNGHVKLGHASGWGSYGFTYFYHNTFYQTHQAGVCYYGNSSIVDNMYFENNIFQIMGDYLIEEGGGDAIGAVEYDYDCMYTPGGGWLKWLNTPMTYSQWVANYGQEAHGISEDPKVTSSTDMHLQSNSPCIDRGVILPGFNDASSPWPYSGSGPDMGAYEYTGGPAIDNTPPYTTGHSPAKGSVDVEPDTNIVVHVRDSGTGVNQSSIQMRVEGSLVSPTITGTPYDYTLTYNPPTDFDYGQVVNVTINAQDLNSTPNVMSQDSYSFTIQDEPGSDSTPPYTSGHNPAKSSGDIEPDTNIVVHVRDSSTGVDISSIQMRVEGSLVSPTIAGTSSDYTLTYNPPTDFDYGQVVNVTINAQDLNSTPNVMSQDSYSFTIRDESGGEPDEWPILPFRVNCAGSDFTDVSGNPWNADQAYVSGYWGFYGSNYTDDHGTGVAIRNTQNDRIYQTERFGLSGYRFDLGNGTYDVTLLFAENYFNQAGQRIFDVLIEGQLELDDVDIYSRVGAHTALKETIYGVTVNDGQLNITFRSVTQYPLINGIIITSSGGNQSPIAANDVYVVEANGMLSVSAPGVLVNDHDVNGDTLSAYLVSDVSHGSLTLQTNGSFVYTPDEDYTGTDVFSYRASDGQASSNTATVGLVVNGGGDVNGGGGDNGGDENDNLEITSVYNFVNAAGKFNIEAIANSSDGQVIITIPKDTIGTNSKGVRLVSIAIEKIVADLPPPPDDAVIVGSVYDITPDGALFNPPISLTISYSESRVPPEVSQMNLVIGTYNRIVGEWEIIPSSANLADKTVTAHLGHFSTYAILAFTRPASFKIENITTYPDTVTCGSNIDIQALVVNTGDLTGSYDVSLMLNGVEYATQQVILKGGDSVIVIFSATPDEAGEYRVAIGDAEATFTAIEYVAPAKFITSNINVSPTEIYLGDSVEISTLVSNTGDLSGVYEAILKIDNEFIDSKNLDVAGGDSEIIIFTYTPETTGEHAINIGEKVIFFKVKSTTDVDVETITMPKPEISRFDITPTYNPGSGEIVSTRIDYQIINSENLGTGSQLILKVFRNGELWEEIPLVTLNQLESDQDSGYYRYVPSEGWEVGTYIFEAELKEPNGVVHNIQFEKFTLIEESITRAISWGSLGIIIGGTLVVLLTVLAIIIYRRREMLRGYVE